MGAEPSSSAEATLGQKQPDPIPNPSTSTMSNGDNYIKFTEFLHLNFSHSKQFTGMPGQINEPSGSFDPFAALRQLLPAMPATPNWNTWSQLQSSSARIGTGQPEPQMPVQLPNIVPNLQPTNPNANTKQNGFNSNYNYNFGNKNMDRYGVDLSPHGNSPATTGFPGTSNLRGLRPSSTEKSTIVDDEEERFPNEKLPPTPKQKRPNSKSTEKSSERFPQRNITAYWIF
jgi:hypothetical protein